VREKEDMEVDLAPKGVYHHVHIRLVEIQKELRDSIKSFVINKSTMVQLLEEILRTFNGSISEFGEQLNDIRRETAKARALECIVQTKEMSFKILKDVYANALHGRSTEEADATESQIIEDYRIAIDKRNIVIERLEK
jgi:hypothetical protein